MPLKVRYLNGPSAGKEILLGDEKTEIRAGRAVNADIGFPDDLTAVSREHFGLRQEIGGYKFIINPEKPVFMDGRPLYDDQALPKEAEIALGTPQGPRLRLERIDAHGANQAKTEVFQPQREIAQDLRTTQVRGSRTAGIVAGVAALVVVLAAAGYFISQSLRSDVSTTQGDLAQTKGDVASVKQQLTQVTTDMPAVRQQLAELQNANIDSAAIIEKNKDSIYMVKVTGTTGGMDFGGATASVVLMPDGRKALATNAHVGKELAESRAHGAKFIAIQAKAPDFTSTEIVDVRIHPGYDMLSDWANVAFTKTSNKLNTVRGYAGGYDVSLLFVAEPEKLGPPTTIASPETIEAIKPGDPLVMMGFPSEGTSQIDADHPAPVSQTGRIISLTDFIYQATDAKHAQLVVHALPSVGGSSGSPMFNAKGEVVAYNNAGTGVKIQTEDGSRVSSAALINYGQRADMMLELINDTAKDNLGEIQHQIEAYDKVVSLTPDQQEARVLDIVTYEAGGKENVEEMPASDGDMATLIPEVPSPKSYLNTFDVNADGGYFFLVRSADGRPVIPVTAVPGREAHFWSIGPVSFAAANVKKGTKLTLAVLDYRALQGQTDQPTGKVHIRMFKLPYHEPN